MTQFVVTVSFCAEHCDQTYKTMTATHPRQAVKNLLRLTAKHEITLEKNEGQSRMSSWRGRTLEEEKMGTKRREPSNEEQTGDGNATAKG